MARLHAVTSYSFDELTPKAKEKAREWFKGRNYPYDDWWESTFEYADQCAAFLGITIYSKTKSQGKLSFTQPEIYFSGFWSQGDGASFIGCYGLPENPMAIVKEAPEEPELHRIAERLVALQTRMKLEHDHTLEASITGSRSNYSHSGTMNIGIRFEQNFDPTDDSFDLEDIPDDADEALSDLLRHFADWIYTKLEQEHDDLCSDEVVDETILANEYQFTTEGDYFGL